MQCQNENDYYVLLYKLCLRSAPCRQPFHLKPIPIGNTSGHQLSFARYQNERDFQFFKSQFSQSPPFVVESHQQGALILASLMPREWLPDIVVRYDASSEVACSSAIDRVDRAVVLASLYSMSMYKLALSDEFFCHDHNEQLRLSPDGQFYCLCKEGKSCDNENHTDQLLVVLMAFLIFGVAMLVVALFYSLFTKKRLVTKLQAASATGHL